MKKTGIKIVCFMLLLAAALFLSNFIYTRWFYHDDIIEADAKMLLDLDSMQNVNDIIYFGESSNATTGANDTCLKSISQLIADQLPASSLGTIQHPAIHAATYLALIKNIKPGAKTKTLIITMNLRSFNADWINSELETPLMRSNVMYGMYPPIIKRMMISLTAFDEKGDFQRHEDRAWHWKHDAINVPASFEYKSVKEWDAALFHKYYHKEDGNIEHEKRELVCAYVKTYAFSIDTLKNPRIRDFDAIVKVAHEKNLHLVFNLLSENVQYADSLVGGELVNLMKENRDLLVKRYNKNGVIVVDNLELVDGKDFVDQNWTTEHYVQRGRIAIAANVVKTAAAYLK